MDLDQLDAEKLGPLAVLLDGELQTVPSAGDLHWKTVLAAIGSPHYFSLLVWPPDVPLKSWQIEAAQAAWCRHNGLPSIDQARRLIFTLEKYYSGIEYDLGTRGISLRELWRARRWRELLNYIDLLPTDSHKNRLMTADEEYMEAVIRASAQGGPRTGPSMADWSQTNAMLAVLIDAVNRNTAVTQAVAQSKGPKPSFDPYPRPITAADRVRYRMEKEAHQSMVSMLLPDRGE